MTRPQLLLFAAAVLILLWQLVSIDRTNPGLEANFFNYLSIFTVTMVLIAMYVFKRRKK